MNQAEKPVEVVVNEVNNADTSLPANSDHINGTTASAGANASGVHNTVLESSANIKKLINCGVGTQINKVLCVQASDLLACVPDEHQDDSLPLVSLLDAEADDDDLDEFTEDSNIQDPKRRICIVTTAALPWRTGTAVNPLLRALYLTRGRSKGHVTLIIPWLQDAKSRIKLYGQDCNFSTQVDQEDWIREYCRDRAHCADEEANLRIEFYDAAYQDSFGSIFPSVDICGLIPDEEADICILEEPEHLNWFRVPHDVKQCTKSGQKQASEDGKTQVTAASASAANELHDDKAQLGWAYKFRHVIGILHTNYAAYMTQYSIGTSFIAAPAIGMMSSIVVRAYCHKVIRLSDVLPSLAPNKEVTCNVHGVRSEFLDPPVCDKGTDAQLSCVYFIGKLIWAKGFDKLLEMQELFKQKTGEYFKIDVYGSGSDDKAIKRAFHGRSEPKPVEETREVEASASSDKQNADDVKAARIFGLGDSVKALLHEITEVEHSHRGKGEVNGNESHPIVAIVGEIGEKTLVAGVSTSKAVYRLADSMLQAGLKMTFSSAPDEKGETAAKGGHHKAKASAFYFDPPRSKYEFRQHPIPARFLGVKDHAILRDIPEHKIFLNMSITEVLCTTTAEALAMGKFVIIPNHGKKIWKIFWGSLLIFPHQIHSWS